MRLLKEKKKFVEKIYLNKKGPIFSNENMIEYIKNFDIKKKNQLKLESKKKLDMNSPNLGIEKLI